MSKHSSVKDVSNDINQPQWWKRLLHWLGFIVTAVWQWLWSWPSKLGRKGPGRGRLKRLQGALVNTVIWSAAIWVGLIIIGAKLFHMLEHSTTGVTALDSLYWAMQIATTTGPGDVTPKTDAGKWLFLGYNPAASVWALLVLGANIVVRQVKNADIFSHREQEWLFGAVENIYAMLNWCVGALFLLLKKHGIEPPPLMKGQNPETGAMPGLPRQPHDLGEDEQAAADKSDKQEQAV